jgi:hypothetical protein
MKLRPESPLEHDNKGRHITGQFHSDDGDGLESGWAIKTWTENRLINEL